MRGKVAIIMGSDSDFPQVEKGIQILKSFEVPFDVRVLSAHRVPKELEEYVESFESAGVDVVIAVAGKAAHLPGVIASRTTLPVIGVPILSSALSGMDALFSIVQMPPGIPVAAVAIDGCVNAALLAIQMLAVKDDSLKQALKAYRDTMAQNVLKKDHEIREKVGLV